MLDNATLVLLAKLKVLAKREGIVIDLTKMSEDGYAALTLKTLSHSDDVELLQIVTLLMNQFGMIQSPLPK